MIPYAEVASERINAAVDDALAHRDTLHQKINRTTEKIRTANSAFLDRLLSKIIERNSLRIRERSTDALPNLYRVSHIALKLR